MRCTMCREEMNPLTVGNVQIDECPHCRGIWFDKGELEEAKNEVDPDLHFLDFKIWSRKALFSVSDMPLTCPRCRNVSLRAINLQEPDIDFTLCPICEGVWLNAGNFKKILDALSREAVSKSASEYVKASLKEGAEIFTNPKRVISEWKDLKAVLHMLRYRVFVENPNFRSILEGIQKSLPL